MVIVRPRGRPPAKKLEKKTKKRKVAVKVPTIIKSQVIPTMAKYYESHVEAGIRQISAEQGIELPPGNWEIKEYLGIWPFSWLGWGARWMAPMIKQLIINWRLFKHWLRTSSSKFNVQWVWAAWRPLLSASATRCVSQLTTTALITPLTEIIYWYTHTRSLTGTLCRGLVNWTARGRCQWDKRRAPQYFLHNQVEEENNLEQPV